MAENKELTFDESRDVLNGLASLLDREHKENRKRWDMVGKLKECLTKAAEADRLNKTAQADLAAVERQITTARQTLKATMEAVEAEKQKLSAVKKDAEVYAGKIATAQQVIDRAAKAQGVLDKIQAEREGLAQAGRELAGI